VRGSRILALRRVEGLMPSLERFLAGESASVLQELSGRLLDKPDARADAAQVGEDLRLLEAFFQGDTRALRNVLRAAGRRGSYVSQDERDALFIAHAPPGKEGPLRGSP
jgi:hypothetical protein